MNNYGFIFSKAQINRRIKNNLISPGIICITYKPSFKIQIVMIWSSHICKRIPIFNNLIIYLVTICIIEIIWNIICSICVLELICPPKNFLLAALHNRIDREPICHKRRIGSVRIFIHIGRFHDGGIAVVFDMNQLCGGFGVCSDLIGMEEHCDFLFRLDFFPIAYESNVNGFNIFDITIDNFSNTIDDGCIIHRGHLHCGSHREGVVSIFYIYNYSRNGSGISEQVTGQILNDFLSLFLRCHGILGIQHFQGECANHAIHNQVISLLECSDGCIGGFVELAGDFSVVISQLCQSGLQGCHVLAFGAQQKVTGQNHFGLLVFGGFGFCF